MPLVRADPPDMEKAGALLEEAASPQSVPAVQQLILELTQHVNEAPDFNTMLSFILEIMQRGLDLPMPFSLFRRRMGRSSLLDVGWENRLKACFRLSPFAKWIVPC
jgi:hypothetical protein